jgi:hypothetical protein
MILVFFDLTVSKYGETKTKQITRKLPSTPNANLSTSPYSTGSPSSHYENYKDEWSDDSYFFKRSKTNEFKMLHNQIQLLQNRINTMQQNSILNNSMLNNSMLNNSMMDNSMMNSMMNNSILNNQMFNNQMQYSPNINSLLTQIQMLQSQVQMLLQNQNQNLNITRNPISPLKPPIVWKKGSGSQKYVKYVMFPISRFCNFFF